MLTRSVYVRRLKKLDSGEYANDEEGEIGEVLSKDIVPVQDEQGGVTFALMLTVEWDKTKHPGLDLVPAMLVENVSHLFDEDDLEDDLEDFDNEVVEAEKEVLEA